MKPEAPNELLSEIARGNCVAFVGSGPSIGAGFPSWSRLLDLMIDWCRAQAVTLSNESDIRHLIKSNNFLLAAQALRSKMGDVEYFRFLREIFDRPTAQLTNFHQFLPKIPFAAVATSNYETLVERAFKEMRPGELIQVFTQVDCAQLGTALNKSEFFVLKAHGTIEKPESIVLTEKDYATLIHSSAGYRTFLKALFLDRTVLFLGFGLNDPELKLLLEELREIFQGQTPIHYALLDVSVTTETEQKNFESHYSVRIIPYRPTANDHPEVNEFLQQIITKIPKHILAHTMATGLTLAKNALESDSHYKWVMNTENEFQLREKFAGASKQKPLRITAEFRFDTNKPEDREVLEAFKKSLATGESITVKSPHLANFIPPEVFALLMPEGLGEMQLTMEPVADKYRKSFMARAVFETRDGQKVILEGVEFKNIQSGTEQMILSNEHQAVPWKFRQVLRFDESESKATLEVNTVDLPIRQAVRALNLCKALSEGGSLKIESVETDMQLSHADIPEGTYPAPAESWIKVCEALDLIQQKTGILFRSPKAVTPDEAKEIALVIQILETGKVALRDFPLVISREGANDFLSKVSQDKPIKLTQYADDFVSVIFGLHIPLGPVFVTGELYITPEQTIKVHQQLGADTDNISLILTPLEEESLVGKFIQWLPKAEAASILSLPAVRESALKNLIGHLFNAAKNSDGSVNVTDLIDLFDEARKASSEEGVLVNPLNTESAETVSSMIQLTVSELDQSVQQQILEALGRKGWLNPTAEEDHE